MTVTACRYISSKQLELQQRCYELMELLDDTNLMSEVLPMDASTEDLEADEDLSFLDDFVEEAINAGARRYDSSMADMSPRDREIARDKAKVHAHSVLTEHNCCCEYLVAACGGGGCLMKRSTQCTAQCTSQCNSSGAGFVV